jgi:hypothetical protein
MCGRFTRQFTWRELVELYRITEPYLTPISNLVPCSEAGLSPNYFLELFAPRGTSGHVGVAAITIEG